MSLPAPCQREFTVLADDLGFPEGPVLLPDGSVAVLEIARGVVTRITADGARPELARTGGGPNGAALAADGSLIVCNNGGDRFEHIGGLYLPVGDPARYEGGRIERVDPGTGQVDVLYAHAGSRPLSAPNDIVMDGDGGFWFTDLGKDNGQARLHGAVCYGRLDGSGCETVVYPAMAPNGIALSPDGGTLYVAETFTARIIAFDVRGPGDLAPVGGLFPGRFVGAAPGRALLDSMAVEAGGNLCIAAPMLGEILVFAPDGTIVERITVPDPLPTNLCFGGPGGRTAYITLSGTGKLIAMDWPRAGLRPGS